MKYRVSFALVLGGLVPIVPMFGGPWALVLSLIYLSTRPGALLQLATTLKFPLVLVFGFWACADLVFGFDWLTIRSVFGDAGVVEGVKHLYEMILISPGQTYRTLLLFLSTYLFFALAIYLSTQPTERRQVVCGLGLGLIASTIVTIYQLVFSGQLVTPNQNEFWLHLGRLPSSFSDPNAYGIVSFLGVGVCAIIYSMTQDARLRLMLLFGAALFLVVSLYSRSRSLMLGLVLWLFVLVFLKSARWALGLALVGLCSIVALVVLGGDRLQSCPEFLSRVCETVTARTGNNSFEGRRVFGQIALAVFKDNFLFGVGLGHFDQLVPLYARMLGIGTGLWLDNANNFYLGILAETGLVGLVALIASVFSFKPSRSDIVVPRALTAIVVPFLLLLLTGPHLNFFEVAFIFAVLISFLYEPSSKLIQRRECYLYGLCFVSVLICSYYSQRGLYPVEHDGSRLFCWTKRTAMVSAQCQAGRARLTVRAGNPDLDLPLRVNFSGIGFNTEVSLANGEYFTVEIPCNQARVEPTLPQINVYVRLTVSRTWIPKRFNLGNDPRPLGVQLVVGET